MPKYARVHTDTGRILEKIEIPAHEVVGYETDDIAMVFLDSENEHVESHTHDYRDGVFTERTPLPRELATEEKHAIGLSRRKQLNGGVLEYDGHRYAIDTDTVTEITFALALVAAGGELPDGWYWRDKDNVPVRMSKRELLEFGAAVMGRRWGVIAGAFTAKDKVEEKYR